MNLLLLSSSRAENSEYLAPYLHWITEHLAGIRTVLFIPYAGVTVNYDDYQAKVQQALSPYAIDVQSIHQFADPRKAVSQAKAILVGGGNTFQLLHQLYQHDILSLMRNKVQSGVPYIGWSAGSNIAGATICTTNDMPIVEPPSFKALNLLPWQLNPHYTDYAPPGFHGETRDMRLAEFMALHPETPIIALPEGSALRVTANVLSYVGINNGYSFCGGQKSPLTPNSILDLPVNFQ